jgi:hypothetical protein
MGKHSAAVRPVPTHLRQRPPQAGERIGPDKRLAETVLKKRQVAIAEGKYLDKRTVPSCTFTELARLYLP